MRRRSPEMLVPNEERTLLAALALQRRGFEQFHGYKLASHLRTTHPLSRSMSYSTLYRCLDRLSERGLVTEVPGRDSAPTRGPKRREFALTGVGEEKAIELAEAAGEDSEVFWNLA
jgi:DNA-binding PadR family transcriptional regulator